MDNSPLRQSPAVIALSVLVLTPLALAQACKDSSAPSAARAAAPQAQKAPSPPPSPSATKGIPPAGPAGLAKGKAGPDGIDTREISDDELKVFAQAYKRVMETQAMFKARMAKASSDTERNDIQTAATKAIDSAVKRSGMTTQDYQRLMARLSQDAELRQRLQDFLK